MCISDRAVGIWTVRAACALRAGPSTWCRTPSWTTCPFSRAGPSSPWSWAEDDGICVLGGEEDGVSPDVLALCSRRVSIEQFGAKGSINVSVAAGILLHAWAVHSSES